ncbi:hypothetical protein HBP99_15200 [Listeria booriae]|uniref:hypothetical protein n=1 Tax=Listeria booriae TaxID=1552123 RepID=UPI0016260985|nr:hypothetical protein [Listeria booriae]MBC1523543.1 hypothetical protein [Listeria booriae]MBC2369974.1 hypothetical protein [Listeria booriae]
MASKNVSNIYVNPIKDNFFKSEGAVTLAIENKNPFGVESKIKVEKFNDTKGIWETSCVLQASEGGLSPNSKIQEALQNNHFFKKGAGKYRIYYEFYKISVVQFAFKLGTLTTSVFNIK